MHTEQSFKVQPKCEFSKSSQSVSLALPTEKLKDRATKQTANLHDRYNKERQDVLLIIKYLSIIIIDYRYCSKPTNELVHESPF